MYLEVANIFLLIHVATSVSVAPTSSSYTSAQGDSNFAAPSTIEPSIDYKSNNAYNQFPYARQFFEQFLPPNNPYIENLLSFNPLTPKPFLLHRIPFFPSVPALISSGPYSDPQPTPYHLHGYLPQQPYTPLTDYTSQPLFDRQYPIAVQQKFGKNTPNPECDFHPLTFRNTRPFSALHYKPENYLEPSSLHEKSNNQLYKFQPSPVDVSLANNIYH